jgi:hypothetical protein
MDESLSLSRSLMNLALELKLSKLSASDTSSFSSSTIVRMRMFSFLVAQPGAGFFLESSTSDVASIEVALEIGRAKLALFNDTILVGCVFPFETERRY